ncbi:T-cell surface glycoprotein CD8 alpha chain [Microcaecilia unicolor]|uniref:T-cell surface glycoprotein CD8 alpha chain n=1 Tax=Microcaecilia unicolor TaxID=1415580 RepID=A0A6P7X9W7_9AMPH|nr:T-cell surface glycoprotein CD8 alpha chain [Microcaecilia unicolor]
MAKLISALLFLNLLLCTSQQLRLEEKSKILQEGFGKLQCSSKNPTVLDQGVYWFHQKNTNERPVFLFYLNSLGKKIPSSRNDERFGSQKDSNGYTLEFKKFDHSQESTYYCLSIYNAEIHFSPGIPLYYPVPTTRTSTTVATVGPKPSSAESRKNCTRAKPPDPREKGVLNIPCELYILVPLAGACLILLIIVVVTSIILHKYSRKKRCKQYCHCRKRPMKENNGRLNPSDRYV